MNTTRRGLTLIVVFLLVVLSPTEPSLVSTQDLSSRIAQNNAEIQAIRENISSLRDIANDPGMWILLAPAGPFVGRPESTRTIPVPARRKDVVLALTLSYLNELGRTGKPYNPSELARRIKLYQNYNLEAKTELEDTIRELEGQANRLERETRAMMDEQRIARGEAPFETGVLVSDSMKKAALATLDADHKRWEERWCETKWSGCATVPSDAYRYLAGQVRGCSSQSQLEVWNRRIACSSNCLLNFLGDRGASQRNACLATCEKNNPLPK